MKGYISVGVSWDTADLDLLEQVAVGGQDRDGLLRAVLAAGPTEAMVLSTCSRVELHAVHPAPDDAAAAALVRLLSRGRPDLEATLSGLVRVRQGDDAVEHLFRVAAGLESRTAGEVEILAQLRGAARLAVAAEGEPHQLRHLVTAALASARESARSSESRCGLLARRAVDRALETAPDGRLQVRVVGAGTIGRQVLAALPPHRCDIVLTSRCPSAASGTRPAVRPLDELPALLREADLVFVATSAGRLVLTPAMVRRARNGRCSPVTFVDLSLPRNVDPAVTGVPGVALLDLDDLGAGDLLQLGEPALRAVAESAAAGARAYAAGLRVRRAGAAITAGRSRLEQVCLDKLTTSLRGAGVADDVLAQAAGAVAGAVAHPQTVLLRQAATAGDDELLDLVTGWLGLAAPATS